MFKSILALFFPKVCVGCKSFLLANENVICTHCRHEIPLTNHHLYPENEAFMKFYGRVPVSFVATLFYYHKRGIVQEIIHSLKYRGKEEIGTVLGDWYSEELKSVVKNLNIDAIIPVPLHKKRLRERGYNQVGTFGLVSGSAMLANAAITRKMVSFGAFLAIPPNAEILVTPVCFSIRSATIQRAMMLMPWLNICNTAPFRATDFKVKAPAAMSPM